MRFALVAFFICSTAWAQPASRLRIGTITIEPLDVYSSTEAEHGSIYRLADRLHIQTRHAVIAKFLLFREGDPYEPERLQETERNLRALRFLKSASVTAGPPHNGVVDVLVVTQDAWSIEPGTQAGSRGGTKTYGATLADSNFLGLGKAMEIGWNKSINRRSVLFNFNDPAFFAPYLRAHLGYAHNSDGYERLFTAARPFFSFATPWAADGFFNTFRESDRFYAGGQEVARFQQTFRSIGAGYGMAIRPNNDQADRVTAGFRLVDDDFGLLPDHPGFVASREFRYVFIRYDHQQNDFLKMDFVDKDLRYEDFNLGRNYSIEAAVSPAVLGITTTTEFVRFSAGDGVRTGAASFILPSVGASARLQPFANGIANANVFFVVRGGDTYPRTFVGRVNFTSGWRLDPEVQFFADGLTGLRGYRAYSFEGSRAIVINLEERLYLGREIFQVASPGVVVFADAGNATNGGISQLFALKTDVGFGFRIGLPRSPRNLLRIDFSYALSRDPFGRRGLLVSFSSGQAF